MKYIEAKKQIEALSSKYNIKFDSFTKRLSIKYKRLEIAYVGEDTRYNFKLWDQKYFSKLPFSNKLYMILAELAMTPLNKRVDERRYMVKVFGIYLNMNVDDSLPSLNTNYESSTMRTKFTLKEIKQLKQRNDIPLDWEKIELETIDED